MTRQRAERATPTFWVENASVEWPEAQAPFYTVGRLTLQPKSMLPPTRSARRGSSTSRSIALPDHRPIGSINRARWVAESASRKARLSGGAVPRRPPGRRWCSRLGAITHRDGRQVAWRWSRLGVLARSPAATGRLC